MGDRVRGWDPKGGTGHGILTFLSLIDRASETPAPVAPPKSTPGAAGAPAPAPSAPSVAKAAPRAAKAKAGAHKPEKKAEKKR